MRSAVFLIPIALLLLCQPLFAEGSAVLVIRNAPDDLFADETSQGSVESDEKSYTVIGLLNPPSLSVPESKNIAIFDTDSNPIPFRFEESSVYREFDDINSMRIAFEVSRDVLSRGPLKVEWGEEVSVQNSVVDKILVDPGQRDRYKTFTVEEQIVAGDDSQVAEIEVIVENTADIYYLWYLLPMVLVFGMLAVRKYVISKSNQSPGE